MSSMTIPTSIPTRPEVRLTRRGRLVIFAAALVALLALGLSIAGVSGAADRAGEPVPTETIVVATGETLWDISVAAAEATPEEESIREMQQRITDLNALESPVLMAGQELRVPTA